MNPVLYILMRTDLASMNPGKAVAHGAHAANLMRFQIDHNDPLLAAWEAEGSGFGTTITLEVDEFHMRAVVALANRNGLHAGIVHDHTYPLRDGAVTHLIPLDTCGYVFGGQGECSAVLRSLGLMP